MLMLFSRVELGSALARRGWPMLGVVSSASTEVSSARPIERKRPRAFRSAGGTTVASVGVQERHMTSLNRRRRPLSGRCHTGSGDSSATRD